MRVEDVEGAGLPDAAVVMMNTRMLNQWLGTHYTLDEVAGMDGLLFELLHALREGLRSK